MVFWICCLCWYGLVAMFLFPGLLGFGLLLSFAWALRIVWLGGFGFGLRAGFSVCGCGYRELWCWFSCASVCV